MPKDRSRARGRAVAPARPTSQGLRAAADTGDVSKSLTVQADDPGILAERARILSVDQASAMYPDDWILMRVLGKDEEYVSVGEVLLHSPLRREISKAAKQEYKDHPDGCVAIFHGGMRRLKGDELRAALELAARGPYVNAAW